MAKICIICGETTVKHKDRSSKSGYRHYKFCKKHSLSGDVILDLKARGLFKSEYVDYDHKKLRGILIINEVREGIKRYFKNKYK